MEGSKIKSIVIVILLLLNGFLLVLSGGRRLEDAKSQDQARTDAMEAIRGNGITLEDDVVPKSVELFPMQASRDTQRESTLAARLLGEGTTREHRGSEVYRYENEAGSVQFHSTGEVAARFYADLHPLADQDPGQHAVTVAKLLDCETRVEDCSVRNGTGTVTLVQTVQDVPVLDCRLVAQYEDGRLESLQGTRLPGKWEELEGDTPITVATALMRLYNGLKKMGDIYSGIESITSAYILRVEYAGSVRLTPVWSVHTDTGSYVINTMTGQLERAAGIGGHSEQSEE